MVAAATGPFSGRSLFYPITASLPEQFRLGFEYDADCLVGVGSRHAARFGALKDEIQLDVGDLLATAALRHFGTPYYSSSVSTAVAKEAALWSGWLSPRANGQLRLGSARNAGRLAELSASIGEATALELGIALFGVPLAQWWRIPQSGAEGMDFKAPGPGGDIAIEAKGGHGSVVASRRAEIAFQKARQSAAEKYGFVLCYEMDGRKELSRKGSYIRVVDPPGDQEAPRTSRRTAIARHYSQLATSIGLQWLEKYLRALVPAVDSRGTDRELDELRAVAVKMVRSHSPRVTIAGESYLGRFFDDRLLAGQIANADIRAPSRYFFFGIAASVVSDLLAPQGLEQLLERTAGDDYAFSAIHQGEYGPVIYSGLSDGLLRVDLASMDAVLGEHLDLSER